jgi:hypothetical protein
MQQGKEERRASELMEATEAAMQAQIRAEALKTDPLKPLSISYQPLHRPEEHSGQAETQGCFKQALRHDK